MAHKTPEARREYRRQNRDRINVQQAEQHKRLRQRDWTAILDHFGRECACCGEDTERFLTVDHINDDGHKHKRDSRIGRGGLYRWIVRNGFPVGFQILCANCNMAKRFGPCPHTLMVPGLEPIEGEPDANISR